MFLLLFVFLFIFLVLSIVNRKNELRTLEYQEWMINRGYIKVKILIYDDEELLKCYPLVITKNCFVGFVQYGIYNFVIGKNTYSDIEVFPEKPNKKNNIKETKPDIINTGLIKEVEKI